MKHKSVGRTLAVLLSVMLIVGLLPTTVFAASTATVQINGVEMQDGVEVQCGEGTAVLDKANGTLTLNNATIKQEGTTPVLRADNGELKVILIGENTITSTTQRPFYNGTVDITIQGTENDSLIIKTDSDGLQIDKGDLTIDGCNIDITSTSWGGMMCWDGTLTIQNNANVTINSFENSLMGNAGLFITDSTVNATARSNYTDWSTTAVSSYGNISITNSTVTATANGDAANAIYGDGTISVNNSEVEATTTSEINAYPAFCAYGNIDVTNRSSVTVKSAGTIGIWSSGGAVEIQDSIAYVAAHDEWDAIRGANGGVTISGSWIETFGSKISPQFTNSDSVLFFNNEGTASGSLTLPGDVIAGKDMQLSVPQGSTVIVPDSVTFTNHGQIELIGELIINGGTVVCDSHTGGTATCTAKAVCGVCGVEYGDFLPHELTKTEEKEATCTENGNIEYWYCNTCGKYFSDEALTNEITKDKTVVKETGHGKTELKNAKEATCTAEGYTGDNVCTVCGETLEKGEVIPKLAHNYKDGKCTVCETIDPDFKTVITKGANGEWQKGTEDGLSFTSNTAFADFQKVQVDGKDLEPSNYDVKEGSTIVTLKASYLETLTVGKHTLAIFSDTGTAETEFTIKAAVAADKVDTNAPQTGDSSNMALWIALLFVSGGILSALTYTKKKQSN